MLIDSSVNQKKQKSKKEIAWIDKFKLSKEYEEEMHEWLEEWDGYNAQKGYKENVNEIDHGKLKIKSEIMTESYSIMKKYNLSDNETERITKMIVDMIDKELYE